MISIIQIIAVLNTVIEELIIFQKIFKKIKDNLSKGNAYNHFDFFVVYYLLLAFWRKF